MKKIVPLSLLAALVMISCSQQYTCTCVDNVQHQPTQTFKYSGKSKAEAENTCAHENHNNSNYTCVLTED